jgi:hypothetical protein
MSAVVEMLESDLVDPGTEVSLVDPGIVVTVVCNLVEVHDRNVVVAVRISVVIQYLVAGIGRTDVLSYLEQVLDHVVEELLFLEDSEIVVL